MQPQMMGQQQPMGGPAYRVIVVDASCCAPVISPEKIEAALNQMPGYKFAHSWVDMRGMVGPCCPIKTLVIVFKRQDIN
ncbi:MAG: hypothetical protein HY908_34245 [Myxococcales bacterium]|nr:hypothetical protein [Myxococcales bacterium]MCC6521214.1 hypothetical protein [Polyangiaceae bacterium]